MKSNSGTSGLLSPRRSSDLAVNKNNVITKYFKTKQSTSDKSSDEVRASLLIQASKSTKTEREECICLPSSKQRKQDSPKVRKTSKEVIVISSDESDCVSSQDAPDINFEPESHILERMRTIRSESIGTTKENFRLACGKADDDCVILRVSNKVDDNHMHKSSSAPVIENSIPAKDRNVWSDLIDPMRCPQSSTKHSTGKIDHRRESVPNGNAVSSDNKVSAKAKTVRPHHKGEDFSIVSKNSKHFQARCKRKLSDDIVRTAPKIPKRDILKHSKSASGLSSGVPTLPPATSSNATNAYKVSSRTLGNGRSASSNDMQLPDDILFDSLAEDEDEEDEEEFPAFVSNRVENDFSGKVKTKKKKKKQKASSSPASDEHVVCLDDFNEVRAISNVEDQITSKVRTNLDTSLDSSRSNTQDLLHDSNCSISHIEEKLRKAENHAAPITPRQGKKRKKQLSLEDSSLDSASMDDDDDEEEEEDDEVNSAPAKIYTLNRMLNDRRKNEELKAMETALLDDVKKGGFRRYLDGEKSSDEEDHLKINPDHVNILARIAQTKDDCLGLPESCPPTVIFNSQRCYTRYCLHSIPHLRTGDTPDMNSSLVMLRTGKIRSVLLAGNIKPRDVLTTALKLMSTTDDQTLALTASIACERLCSNQTLNSSFSTDFVEAICNLSVKSKVFSPASGTSSRMVCKQCNTARIGRKKKLRRLLRILSVLNFLLQKNAILLEYVDISKYLTLCCHLLAADGPQHRVEHHSQQLLILLSEAAGDWPAVRLQVTRSLLESVVNLNTLEHIASKVPSDNERCLQLRRSIAQAALLRTVNHSPIDDVLPTGIDTYDLENIAELAKNLTIAAVKADVVKYKPNANKRDVHYAFSACVFLLQICVGNGYVNKLHKSHLESISNAIRSHDVSIRDTGILYLTEVKHFLRTVTACIDRQLRAMPRISLYQQNIFKFLSSSRVDEHVVGGATESDDRDDETPSEDATDNAHCISTEIRPGSTVTTATSKSAETEEAILCNDGSDTDVRNAPEGEQYLGEQVGPQTGHSNDIMTIVSDSAPPDSPHAILFQVRELIDYLLCVTCDDDAVRSNN